MAGYRRSGGLALSFLLLISTLLSAVVIPLPIAKAAPTYSWSTFTVAASGDDVETLSKTGFSNYTTDGDNLWVHSNEYTTRAWLRFEGLGAITNAGGVIDQIILSMYSGADEGADYTEVPGGYVTVAAPRTNWNWELTEANILASQMNPIASFDGDYLSPSGSWFNWTISTGDPRDWYAWSSDFNDVFTCYVGGYMQYSPEYTYYRSFASFDEGHPAKLYVKYHTGTGYQNVLDEFGASNATYVQTWNNYNFWSVVTEGLSGWDYKTPIEINGTEAGIQTNYQVEIDLDMFSTTPFNADDFQTTPTSDATNQTVHPSILYFADGWNGYKYWMAYTPYPAGNPATETPEIVACNDGESWEVPPGLTNPVVARDATRPNSDPCLFYNEATDEIWLYHRHTDSVGSTYDRIYLKKSSDGVNWGGTGKGTLILDVAYTQALSPSIVKINSTYHMWYIDARNGNTLEHRTSADGESWGAETTCTIYGNFPSGKEPWHFEIRYMEDYSAYWMLLTVCNVDAAGSGSILTFANSIDGTNWYLRDDAFKGDVFLNVGTGGSWDDVIIYKSTSILIGSELKIWYSARKADGGLWHIGYTNATIDTENIDILTSMKPDGGDIRFTENDGTTELYYWLEHASGGKMTAWPKLNTIPVNGTTIYIHYGNPTATTTSSIIDASWNNIGDDFNDNSMNATLWESFEHTTASVSETNNQIEITCPASGDRAGYISLGTQILNNVSMRIYGSNDAISSLQLLISLTRVNETDPYGCNDLYRIMIYHHWGAGGEKIYIQKKVGGVGSTLYTDAWISGQEEVNIRIEDGTIRFYEQDTERHNEAWDLSSRVCYIYIFGSSGAGAATGMDSVDDFWIHKYVASGPILDELGSEMTGGEAGYVATDPDGNVITPDPFEDIDACVDFVKAWDEENGPVLAVFIANIDAVEWVFEGKKRYEFTVEYINVNLTDIEQVGVGFTDSRNHFHSVWYDRDANTLTVTSPEDGISGWLHSIEEAGEVHTGINVTAVFHIMFNVPIPDSDSVSAYARIIDTDDSGWIDGSDWDGGFIFNIYNLGGLSTLTDSGMAGRVSGGDIFEIYAADTRTPILVPNEDFDVRQNPINWWEWGQSEQDLLDDVDWMLWMPWRSSSLTMYPTNVLPDGAAQDKRSYTSYPFGLRILDNLTDPDRFMYMEKNFWREIDDTDDELVFAQFHMMCPNVGSPGDPGAGGEIRVSDRSIKEEGSAWMALQFRFDSIGNFTAYNSTASAWVHALSVVDYQWYNVTGVFNLTTQMVDIYIDDVLKLDDLPFVDIPQCDSLKTLWIGRANAAVIRNDFYVDDVRAWTDWDADYGGISEATMLFSQLQHWSMDFDVFVENGQEYAQGASGAAVGQYVFAEDYSDHGYWEFGWDVMLNETWVNDFLVARVNISDGRISGRDNWIKYNVTWYDQGEYVKSDLLYGLFEGYSIFPGSDKDTSGWHWDIWFNRANASTIVGARLNTEYYGMSDKAVWWAVWSSLWKPMRTEVSESTLFIDLQDAEDNIHSAKDVLFVRSWVKVLRTSEAEFAYKIVNIGGLDFMVARDTMSGIDTPPIRETVVPDVISGFFGSALGGIFSAALKRLGNTLAGFGMGFFSMSIEFIDNVFAALGYPALVSTIFGWMDSLFASVPILIGHGLTMIEQIFRLITVSASDTLIQLTGIITIWVGMYSTTMDLLTGVLTPGINLWNDLGVNSFIQIGAILYPFWLIMMGMDKGTQAVMDHLNSVLNIGSFFLNFILNVGSFFMGLLTGLIGAIRG